MKKLMASVWRKDKWVEAEMEDIKRGDLFQLYSSKGELLDMSRRDADKTYGLAIYDAVPTGDGHSTVEYEPIADIIDSGSSIKATLAKYPVNEVSNG